MSNSPHHSRHSRWSRLFSNQAIQRAACSCLLVLVPFCTVLIVHGGEFTLNAYVQTEAARAALGLPMRWIIKSCLPIGGLLLLLAGLSVAIRNAMFLAGRATGPAPTSGALQRG